MSGILTPADILGIANQTDPARGATEVGYANSSVGAFLDEIANGTAPAIENPTGTEVIPASQGAGLGSLTSGGIAQIAVNIMNSEVTVPIAGIMTILTFTQYNAGIINFTGALTADSVVQLPSTTGIWIFSNNCTGGFSLTLQADGGSGATVLAPQTKSILAYSDGTNVILASAGGAGGGGANNTFTKYDFVIANQGQTEIDVNYTPGNVVVTRMGATLPAEDYVAVNGAAISFTTPLNLGDEVSVIAFSVFSTTGVQLNYEFIATLGQTVFDAVYTPGAVHVYENGIILLSTDYVANDGLTVTLVEGAPENAEIKIVSQSTASVAGIVPSIGGTFTGPVSGVTPAIGDDSTLFATTAFVQETIQSETSIPLSDVNVVLSALEATYSIIKFTGTLTGNVQVTVPAPGHWIFYNATSGAFTVTLTNGTGATFDLPQSNVEEAASDAAGGILVVGDGGAAGVTSFDNRTGAVVLLAADVTGVGGALLNSPAFTGTPTAPTAANATNTTQLATTAFVQAALSGVSGGINYIGTWNASTNTPTLTSGVGTKGNLYKVSVAGTTTVDGNSSWSVNDMILFDGTVWDKIDGQATEVLSFNTRIGAITLLGADITSAGGALVASPTFTGVPAAPTAALSTNTTQLATTAFVQAAGLHFPTTSGTAITIAVTFTLAELNTWAQFQNDVVVTLPPIATVPVGSTYTFLGGSTGGSLKGNAAEQLMSVAGILGNTLTVAVGEALTIAADGNSLWYVVMDGVGSTALAGYAPLNSPALTGTPTAPTPAPGNNSTDIATTAFVDTALSTYAPLASPALSGTPTAPTATPGTNTTQLATTAFVEAAVSGVTAGVTSFNTRSGAVTLEGSDITSAGGALLASPTFTGTPQAPTPAPGDNDTSIATTAFVTAAVTAGGGAPLNSPAFTGAPTAPTQQVGNTTTELATCAFVYDATQLNINVPLTNANVQLATTQYGAALLTFTGTLTGNIIVTFPTQGQWTLYNATTGAFTITLSSGVGVTRLITQGATLEIVSNSTAGILPSSNSAATQAPGNNSTFIATTAFVDTALSSYAPLASPTLTGRTQSDAYSFSVSALASSATQTLNLSTATEFEFTLTAATTVTFTGTPPAGTSQVAIIRLSNGGAFGITWGNTVQFAAKTAPTLTTSGTDILGVLYDPATTSYMIFVIGLNVG